MKNFLGRGLFGRGHSPYPDSTPGTEGETPSTHPTLLDAPILSRLRRSIYSPKLPNKMKIGTPHFLEQSYAPVLVVAVCYLGHPKID